MSGFIHKVLKSGLGIFTSRVFGLVRDVAVAGYYGASGLTDAFFVAFAVPNLFRAFFAEGALSSAFVPFLSDNMKHKSRQAADNYLTSLLIAVSLMIMIILLAVSVFPEWIIMLFMPGYADDAVLVAKAAQMIVILMPYLLFVTVCALLSGYLNLKGSYFVAHSSTAMLNIAMIFGAWLGYRNGVDIIYLCYGVIAGGVLQLLYVAGYAFIKGYRPTLKGGYSRDVGKTFYLVLPSLAGVGITQFNFMIGRILASYLAVGSISYLYYANRLFQFPLGMFAVAVGTVALTEISRANSDGDFHKRNSLIDKAVNAIFAIMLPAGTGLMVLAYPIVELVYARMNFTADNVAATAAALQMYTVGLLFFSFLNVFSRVFHSEKDMKTPVKGAFIGLVSNLVFNLILIKPMGHSGIALASGIAAVINCAYLYYKIRDYRYSIAGNISFLAKLLAGSAVMGAVVWWLCSVGVGTILAVAAGPVIYYCMLRLTGLKAKEVFR